jgi:hypothetical protein
MIRDDDAILRELLRRNAPPARDPLFRVLVHERRERARFRRRALVTSAIALAAIAVAVVSTGAPSPSAADAARVLFFGIVLSLAAHWHAPELARLLPRIRR